MLPAVLAIIALISFGFYTFQSERGNEMIELNKRHGFLNSSTRTFEYTVGEYESSGGYEEANSSVDDTERDEIEIALIRTCRSVSTQAHANGCAAWDQASQMWSFVGTAGTTGPLTNLYVGPTSNTLLSDCSNIREYGRYIFAKAVPSSVMSGKGYTFNLSGLDDNHADACAYDEIVGK